MSKYLVTLILLFSFSAFAEELPQVPQIEKVKTFRNAETFFADLEINGDWPSSSLEVTFLTQTLQIDLPKISFPKGKYLVRVDDPTIKSVYIYQPETDVVRVRIVLNKGNSAKAFQKSLQIIKREGHLAFQVNGTGDLSLAKNGPSDLVKAFEVQAGVDVPVPLDPSSVSGNSFENEPMLKQPRLVASASTQASERSENSSETQPLGDSQAQDKIAESNGNEAQTELELKTKNLSEAEIPLAVSKRDDVKKEKESTLQRLFLTCLIGIVLLGTATLGLRQYAKRKKSVPETAKIKILTQHFIGPKKSLAIVQVAGESILIGITDQNISMIKSLSLIDDEIPETVPNNFMSSMNSIDDFEEEESSEDDAFTTKRLLGIRDRVSTRLKGMRTL